MRESRYEIAIWGNHLDLYQHVNHARYLEFLEEARWVHFGGAAVKKEMESLGLGFVIVNVNIDYFKSCTIGDVLEIKTALDRVGNKSAKVIQQIFLKNTSEMAAEANITFVLLNVKTNKAMPIEGKLKDILFR